MACAGIFEYDHLKTESLPYKPMSFSVDSKRLEPDTKYSNLPEFHCLYLDHYFSDRAEICQWWLFSKRFYRNQSQNQNSLKINYRDATLINSIDDGRHVLYAVTLPPV